ncbi:hypothetical protein AKJ37_01610 [candidate division MSBL1 archaeon SCGC-AAA259I09]|uniref:Uncharacterized protein n=1 Tax=candidate division MSBL1 archaeon SCGC-AAA259I09 TaxID=1698267 RepID=A0A133UUZ5_9EURY|nr:hypothetical protein AKJ37_01610 [candidate division MSBL1 archaeon SCGC-AAA259I09]
MPIEIANLEEIVKNIKMITTRSEDGPYAVTSIDDEADAELIAPFQGTLKKNEIRIRDRK